jgi:hypothetical protein
MHIQFIQGEFSANDAIELLNQMIRIKIKYHENSITRDSSEEDIKYRESKVRYLQNLLSDARNIIIEKGETVRLEGTIKIE